VSDPVPSTTGHDVHIATATDSYRFHLPLLGLHQVDNARTAIAVLETLRGRGFDLPADAICRGLSAVRWPARVQLVTEGPPIVIADGAHNEHSALALVSAIERHFPDRNGVVIIYGVTRGHDHESTARALSQLGARFIATQSRHPRTLDAGSLAEALETVRIHVQGTAINAADALALAKALCKPGDLVVACGSLFVAAEIIEEVTGIEPEIYEGLTGPIALPYSAAVP
jgi:dihydrofolate synthase/folylpolyglutamate synthase